MAKPSRRTVVLVAALLVLAAASVTIHFMFAGPSRATAPDEALRAADEIVKQQGGGEQPKNAEGVPLDAVVDPNNKPGTIRAKPSP